MNRSHTRRIRVSRAVRTPMCVAVLAVAFLLALSGVAFADVWTDISDATWQDVYHVSAADASTVAEGFPDGTFRPYQAVTRGQFAKMVTDGLDIPLYDPAVPSFKDVPTDHIFYEYIEGAVADGVISGYPDDTYRPNNNIMRQQANSILGKWLSQQEIGFIGGIQGADGFYDSLTAWFAAEGDEVLSAFDDRLQIAPVHRPGTAYLVMRGVVLGSSSGATTSLDPLAELSRAQAVTMILRTRDVVFEADLPSVTHIDPAAGAAAGGTSVVITGTGFGGLSGAAAVKFGPVDATSYVVDSLTQITAVAPAGTAGSTVDVTVTTPAGISAASAASKYSYGAPTVTLLTPVAGVAEGGNSVVITGTGFTGVIGAAAVKFGTVNATSYVVDSATQITAVAPAGTADTVVDVTVTTPAGTSATAGSGDDYTYGVPTVTALSPTAGTTAGGTPVTITGTNFVAGATVAFGAGNPATGVAVVNATTITCLSPVHSAGVVDVMVTTPAGTSSTAGAGNDYTYLLDTADVALALTTPAPGGGNSITGGGAIRTVAVDVVNTTASVVLTGTKLSGQAVVIAGTNAADVITTGTGTAPIYTVNTASVAAAGGSKVFTLTVSEAGRGDIVYTVTVTVAAPYTADVALVLTTPAPGGGNSITGGGAVRTVAVDVVNATTSVVLTGTKLAAQTVAIGGTNAANVTAGGTAVAPTYTVDTSSVSTGGSKVFTLTVSEAAKADIVYTVTVTVGGPTADVALALTTPAPGGGNTITGGGAVRTVAVGVVNTTASVVLTGTKLASQTVVVGGANAANVTPGGSATAPTYTVDTSSVSAAGGSRVFTLTVSETGKADIVYTVTVTVSAPYTADIALALTIPAAGGGNSITGGGAVRTVAVGVVNTTASVVLTGTKLAAQTVVIGGTNAANVTAGGTPTAPTYSVDTSSVSAAGGSKAFTLTVNEAGKADIVYTVTVTVAIPDTANIALALTTPAPGVGNTITGGGAVRTVTVSVVNLTASVVLTGTKLSGQAVVVGGTHALDVVATGTGVAPIYTVNTSSVSAVGGSKVFTLTVSETGKADIVYTVTVTVAGP